MELHLIIVDLSHAVKSWRFTAWQDAAFVAEAAKKFGHKYVWWYRTAADRPWLPRHRVKVTNKELDDENSPFGRAAADRLGLSGGMFFGGEIQNKESGKRSPTAGKQPAEGTGPGLEKP